MTDLARILRDLSAEELPRPGAGRTVERFGRLWEIAAGSPSLGRLAEAHHDAVAILREAGQDVPTAAVLGVWAADGPEPLRLTEALEWGAEGSGERPLHLAGEKQWCSGASLVTHALVTAHAASGTVLVLVDMAAPGISLGSTSWVSPAFAGIDTRSVCFDLQLTGAAVVGVDDWYLRRPGFWHGAVGVAACWAGCAAGIVDDLADEWRTDPHALAHRGAVDAALWGLRAALGVAAAEIDADPLDVHAAHLRALRVRHLVDAAIAEVTDRIWRALGPKPMAFADSVHVRLAETDLYRRQCHAERDLEQLGRLLRDAP